MLLDERALLGDGERLEALGELRARERLLLDEAVDEHAHRHQRRGLGHLRRERAQRVGLDLAVLEAAELILQALERLDERLADLGRIEAGEELEQVAQLLADLAQLVQVLGGRVVVDRLCPS